MISLIIYFNHPSASRTRLPGQKRGHLFLPSGDPPRWQTALLRKLAFRRRSLFSAQIVPRKIILPLSRLCQVTRGNGRLQTIILIFLTARPLRGLDYRDKSGDPIFCPRAILPARKLPLLRKFFQFSESNANRRIAAFFPLKLTKSPRGFPVAFK
jgi:hypothetical protein